MATTDRRGVSVNATDSAVAGDPNPGLAIKAPALVATTGNITLSGVQSVDGVTVGNNAERVLVWQQADQTANGLYSASSGPWKRCSDMQSNSQVADGLILMVVQGTLHAGTQFRLTSADPIIIGTSAITFVIGVVNSTRNIITTAPLAGGGDLSQDRTLSINPNGITYGLIQQETAARLLGNPTGAIANVSEISLGATLAFSGSSLETDAMTGDVAAPANSFATTIQPNVVSNAKFRQSAGLSVVGNSGSATSNVADITGAANQVLVVNAAGTSLTFGLVTYAGIQNVSASRLLGNPTGAGTSASEISLGATLAFSGSAVQTVALTGDVTTAANSFATTIAAGAVTNAKLAAAAAYTIKGNAAGASAAPTDFAIGALTQKASPTASDLVMIQDQAAAGALKYATVSSISAAGSVTSIAGNVGAFTLGPGLTNNINELLVDPSYLRGYVSGLTLSNDAVTPNTILDVAVGVATSDDQTTLIKLASAYTKTTGAWAVGSGNGALDTGTIGASSWYFVFLIERPDTGVVDILFSLSPTSPTMPASYTKKRRIGAFATSSSNIRLFTQIGNEFIWNVPVSDVVATNPGTSAILATLTVPAAIVVRARFVFYLQETAAVRRTALITSPSIADTAPSPGTASSMTTGVAATAGAQSSEFNVWTNTSSQVRYRLDGSAATTNAFIMTEGWIDNF